MGDIIALALELVRLAGKLLDGSATDEDKARAERVRDILPEKSASQAAAERLR
jgi:hypothetical protein